MSSHPAPSWLRRRGLGQRRRGYRRGQSAVLFLLAMLVVLACASGPWYERAVEQAAVHSTLADADRVTRSLSIGVDPNTDPVFVTPQGDAKHLFGRPVAGTDIFATLRGGGYKSLATTITHRDRECAHLTLTSGRCPVNSQEVLASAPLARRLHLSLRERVSLTVPTPQSADSFRVRLMIVGLYRPFSTDNDYWFGTHYSSPSGIVVGSDTVEADTFFASDFYVAETAAKVTGDMTPRYYVNTPLLPDRVGVQDLGALRRTVDRLAAGEPPVTDVGTGLSQYVDEIETGRRDARRIVLAISVQLALLAVIAFGVVVAAAADQRRPELALARLRGRSPARTAAVFLREVGGLALLAAIPGVLAAYGLVTAACHFWLVPGTRPEWRWPVLAAVAGSLVVVLLVVAAIGLRASRQPITDMLRQVPKRVSRVGVGTAEATVAVAALAGLIASFGNGDNALATFTPTFLAVLVGLVLSRLIGVGARVAGRRALWRGNLVRAVAALGIARRTGARFTITVLCVATAVVVFAGQQYSVASNNRQERAAATIGAPVVLDVSALSGPALTGAVRAADPSEDYATPVVVVTPPGIGAAPTVAVEPSSFGRIASWGRADLHPSAATLRHVLPTHPAPAISFTATSVEATLSNVSYSLLTHSGGNPRPRVSVHLNLVRSDGKESGADLGPLPAAHAGPITLRGSVECARGCHVRGIQIDRPVLDADPIDLRFTVAALRAGADNLRIGTAKQWASTTEPDALPSSSEHTAMSTHTTSAGLQFHAIDDGANAAMQYLELPIALPMLLAGPRPDNTDPLGYLIAAGLDGGVARTVVTGRVPFVPRVGRNALVVDLDLAIRSSEFLDATAHPSIWLARDDPQREQRFVAALKRHGVTVVQRSSEATTLSSLAHSAPGWSAQLTLAAAVISELLAMALLVLVVLTSRRSRQQDLAAMRLVGLARRKLRTASILELLIFVVAGVLGGAAAGVAAVRLSLSSIPIFSAAPTVPLPTVFPIEWVWLAGAALVSAVLLIGATVALARSLVRHATPQRLAGDTL